MKPYNVKVTFYKETGKYYADCLLSSTHYLWEEEFKQDIVNNQNCLKDGWQGEFIVTTENENDNDPFCCQMFKSHEFKNIKKEIES